MNTQSEAMENFIQFFIDKVPEDNFDMESWTHDEDDRFHCGTAMCLGGWMAYHLGYKRLADVVFTEPVRAYCGNHLYSFAGVARKKFGGQPKDWVVLFSGSYIHTKAQAVEALRELHRKIHSNEHASNQNI